MARLGVARLGKSRHGRRGMASSPTEVLAIIAFRMCLVHSGPVILALPEHRWVCSRCDHTHVTREVQPHTPFHPCRGLKGLTAPMTPEGERVKVTTYEREDYLNDEIVTRDDEGRPVMSVEVTRDSGTDVAVFAPQAKVELG